MTITREHLDLAALAAGHTITSFEPVGPRGALVAMLGVNAAGYGIHWRPHLDDGDAARLADKLLMYVDSRGTAVQARVVGAEWHRVARDGNPSAWREAVVLCAAAVGALVTGPHKMGCDHKLNAAPTDHCEDILHMVPCAVCAVGHATLQRDASGYYRACEACGSGYAGADELALQRGHVVDVDKMAAAVTKDSSAARPGAAARAKLEATPEGRALLAAAKAHLLQCLQLTPEGVEAFTVPTAAAMEVRPCRCGPDGCSDSSCEGRPG